MFVDRIHNLEEETKLLKTKQFTGSSDVAPVYTYDIDITQNITRAYGRGTNVIYFHSDKQIAPLICFIGNVLVNGEDTQISTGSSRSGVSYDLGYGMVIWNELGSTVSFDEKSALAVIEWTEGRGQTGTTEIRGTLFTSSPGKVEIRNVSS